MIRRIALDSNLALLFVVGRSETGLIPRHKRLSVFDQTDYELLLGWMRAADTVLVTPNALTEVSNLAPFGMHEPGRSRVMASLKAFAATAVEIYRPARDVVQRVEFARLGLTDSTWLYVLEDETRFLTVDNELYLSALRIGRDAVNFDHLRKSMHRR